MKKMSRRGSLLLVVLTVFAMVMAGCKGNNNNEPKETKTPVATVVPEVTKTPDATATPDTQTADMKNITVDVVNSQGETKTYNIKSDAATLYDALMATEGLTLEGGFGDYGYFITAVNGEAPDFEKDKAYWAFYVNGEYGQTSVDTQPIAEGDTFKLVYEKSTNE